MQVEEFTPLSGRLMELARQLGVPVQAVLLAGHLKVLATMSGQRRAVSCVTQNGRPETAGGERSLGLYLNSLPLSLELGAGSWRELIAQVAEMSAASMQYRGYPLVEGSAGPRQVVLRGALQLHALSRLQRSGARVRNGRWSHSAAPSSSRRTSSCWQTSRASGTAT